MPPDPNRHNDPTTGYHRIHSTRRFRYLEQDPTHTVVTTWLAQEVTCPLCGEDTDLVLMLDENTDPAVTARCPNLHEWLEPRIDRNHFIAYSKLQAYADIDPDRLWITDEGFGEEPPQPLEPVEVARQLAAGWGYGLKYAKRRAKSKAKAKIRKPVKKAKRQAINAAHRPVAAALNAAWTWQAGGTDPVKQPKRRTPKPPKTPPLSAYRKAYGTPAPKRGPKCLVCTDTGRITGPDFSIPCTEH